MNELIFAIIAFIVFGAFFGGVLVAQELYLKRVTRLMVLLQTIYDEASDHPDFKVLQTGTVEAATFNLLMWIRHVRQAR